MGTLAVSPYKYNKARMNAPFGMNRDDNTNTTIMIMAVTVTAPTTKLSIKCLVPTCITSGTSVTGVILPPKSCLSKVASMIKQAGGMYIADEV
jgi:4-aminobutyrate aminotransferase-like enzyme